MSSLKEHTIQSVTTSAVLYPFIGNNAVTFGLSVIFIDIDHVIEYIRQTGSWRIFGVFPCCQIIENAVKQKCFFVLSPFHTLEFFLLIFFLGRVNPLFYYMLAGMLYHLSLDMYHLARSGILFLRAFSLIEYFIRARQKKYITSFVKLLQQDEVDVSDVKHFSYWFNHWKNINPKLRNASIVPSS